MGKVREMGGEEVWGRCGRMYGVSVGRGMEGVGNGKGKCGECEEVWESVWGECGGGGKVYWGVGEVKGEVWGKVREDGGV